MKIKGIPQNLKETLPEEQRTQNIDSVYIHLELVLQPIFISDHVEICISFQCTNYIGSKVGHQVTGGATCNFGHQVASLPLPHCLELPYWYYQFVLSWYLQQQESHQFSLQKGLLLTQ